MVRTRVARLRVTKMYLSLSLSKGSVSSSLSLLSLSSESKLLLQTCPQIPLAGLKIKIVGQLLGVDIDEGDENDFDDNEGDLKAKEIGRYNGKKGLRGQDENNILEAPTKVLLFAVPCLRNR